MLVTQLAMRRFCVVPSGLRHVEERLVRVSNSLWPLQFERRERVVVNQTTIRATSKATLGKPLRDGMERIWAFPNEYIPS